LLFHRWLAAGVLIMLRSGFRREASGETIEAGGFS
jgi:hypothetical protein